MDSNLQKRGKHFVDRQVQGAIVLRFVLHWALFFIATALLLVFVEMVAGDPRHATENLLSRHKPTVLAVLLLMSILIRDLCKFTNRFAGPMVRLRHAMRDRGVLSRQHH